MGTLKSLFVLFQSSLIWDKDMYPHIFLF